MIIPCKLTNIFRCSVCVDINRRYHLIQIKFIYFISFTCYYFRKNTNFFFIYRTLKSKKKKLPVGSIELYTPNQDSAEYQCHREDSRLLYRNSFTFKTQKLFKNLIKKQYFLTYSISIEFPKDK